MSVAGCGDRPSGGPGKPRLARRRLRATISQRQKGDAMKTLIERQRPLIDKSGLGLLPGIGFAFALALLAMAALLLDAWWVTIAVLLTLFVITGAVVWVVFRIADDGDGEPRA